MTTTLRAVTLLCGDLIRVNGHPATVRVDADTYVPVLASAAEQAVRR